LKTVEHWVRIRARALKKKKKNLKIPNWCSRRRSQKSLKVNKETTPTWKRAKKTPLRNSGPMGEPGLGEKGLAKPIPHQDTIGEGYHKGPLAKKYKKKKNLV